MSTATVKKLAKALPDNIRILSTLIARKPSSAGSTQAWTVNEAFSLYTDDITVNLILAQSNVFAALNWPFPAYLDLKAEWELSLELARRRSRGDKLSAWLTRGHYKKVLMVAKTDFMSEAFRSHSLNVFEYWKASPILASKLPVIKEIEEVYQRQYWAVCLPAALPLLDFMIRSYFGTTKTDIDIETLRDAFKRAGILPKDLKPGYAVWEGQKNPDKGNALASSLADDLRLPGVLLSSFLEFANTYYGRYDSGTPKVLNRHAILHCATEYWSREYTSKLLTFLDLTLRLERPLEVLIRGAEAPWPKAASQTQRDAV